MWGLSCSVKSPQVTFIPTLLCRNAAKSSADIGGEIHALRKSRNGMTSKEEAVESLVIGNELAI